MTVDLEPILTRDLAIIRDNWEQLLDLPHTPTGDKVDTSTASPTPIPISVLSLRFDAAMILASWAHLVHDEMRLTTGLDLLAVVPITRFLTRHARFLADHEINTYAVEEIGYYAGAIVELVNQTRAARFTAGNCPDCEGKLMVTLQVASTSLPSELRCSLNAEHVWSQERWRWLGDRIGNESIRCESAARRLASAIGLTREMQP